MNWTDDDLDLALRDLRDEPLPPGSTEAVRARVLAQLDKPRRPWWPWLFAPALAATLLLLLWLRPQSGIPSPPLLAKAPPPPLVQAPVVAQPSNVGQAPGLRRPLRPPKALPPSETHFVKLVTDDPDVVILWAMNSEGEAQ